MRVCIEKSTGKLIEAQSGGSKLLHLGTLLQNAIGAGYKKEDVEVKYITKAEFEAIMEAKKPVPVPVDVFDRCKVDAETVAELDNATTIPQLKSVLKKMLVK